MSNEIYNKMSDEIYNNLYIKEDKDYEYNGSSIEKSILQLETQLSTLSSEYRDAVMSGNISRMTTLFSRMIEIEDYLKSARAIKNKQQGISYITKFGTQVYSSEQLDFFNNMYDEMNNEKHM